MDRVERRARLDRLSLRGFQHTVGGGAREKFVARQALGDGGNYPRSGYSRYRRSFRRIAEQAQDFVDERRADHRIAAGFGRRIAQHHAPRRHREREKEEQKILAVALVARAQDSSCAVGRAVWKAPPESVAERPVERELYPVGQQRVLGMVGREYAVVESDREDQIEIEAARF